MNASCLHGTARGIIVAASIFSTTPLLAQSITQDTFTGAFGTASISYTQPDGCTNVSVEVEVSEHGTTSLNAPGTTPSAFASVFIYNYCTGDALFEGGSITDGIRFSAQADGNGSRVPKSVTASGTIPMDVVFAHPSTTTTDTLTFDMTLYSVGPALDTTSDSKQTNYLDTEGKSSVQIHTHEDDVSSGGSIASFNVSTANLGLLLPTTDPSSSSSRLASDKNRTVTVTH